MSKPKVLLWDIETGYNLLFKHDLYPDYVSYKNIDVERHIICASWKWLGSNKIHSVSILDDPALFKKDVHNDSHVVKVLAGLMNEADAVIAHNGDKFDTKFLNGRMLVHGLLPHKKPLQIDTLKIAKKHFKLNSNRLDYLGQLLGVGHKMTNSPGLWERCFRGEQKAIKEMIRYNKQDVQLLEDVYYDLRTWEPAKLNHNLFSEDPVCPTCGSGDIHARGYTYTRAGTYQRYHCNECGSWFQSKKNLKTVEMR